MNVASNNVVADPSTLQWWAAALKGQRGPITADEPMTGYYRARSKNKQTGEERLFAVAYWWHKGNCFCRINGPGVFGKQPTLTGAQLQQMIERWPYVSKEPIEYDVYCAVIGIDPATGEALPAGGKPWPDIHVAPKTAPAETSENKPLDAERQVTTTAPAAGAVASEVDTSPQAVLRRKIETAVAGLTLYTEIDSDAMAGAAQSLRDQLNKLGNEAKKAREDANRPHNDAIRANGKIWTPLEDVATAAAKSLRDGPIRSWEVHKREQADAAAKAARAAGAPVTSNAPAPSAKIKGATGKAASVQEIKIAVIHDLDLVYGHFRNNDQVRAILQGLSNAAVRAGISVPGTTTDNDVSIR